MECGREFDQITGKHVKTHGFNTVAEYLEKHPGAQTVQERKDSKETIERKRIARLGKKHSDEAKARIGAGNKGKKMSAEAIDKWRESYREYLDEHGSPMLGKDRGEAFKAKMSAIAKARPKELVDAKVAQMLAARRGSKATPEQRERYSEARLKFIAENPDKMLPRLFNTKPEREFKTVLDEMNISYKHNVRVGNRLYDFQIGTNVLIELDGPFHYNYKMYGDKSMPDEDRMALFLEAKKKDEYKTELAKSNGYVLYRIIVGGNLPDDWKAQLENQGCTLFK
jgi:hypothetical protein